MISFIHTMMNSNTDYEQGGLFIRQGDCHRKYLFSQILWLKASGSYCYIHFCNDTQIIVSYPLGYVEQALPVKHFLRIHRSYIVNLNHVEILVGHLVGLGKSPLLPVSAPYRQQLYDCFCILGTADATHESEE